MPTINLQEIVSKIKALKLKELAYPLALIVFFTVIAVVLTSTSRLLSANINKAFGESVTAAESLRLDRANYAIVAKKFGIVKSPIPAPTQVVPVSTPATTTPAATTTPTKK